MLSKVATQFADTRNVSRIRLLALTALDLGVHLVGARVEQLDGLILQLPHIAIQAKASLRFSCVDPLARDQLGRFNSYCLGLCYYCRFSRAGRQAEAEQPNHEQACCCA